ncbi:hypothetical protein AB0J21_02455 [Streptomyces sp. NPDC049954]|uniref:hypothetical protein n=1 Tax=Streptomyces sp. NPDC049954 TaxID=3155779 RepID=UPI003443E941
MSRTASFPPRSLLISGTVGAGKTSVAEAVGALLAEARVPHAVLDLDALCRLWPAPPGDPFRTGLLALNLRDVAAHCLEAGALVLVLAGVAEDAPDRERYARAVGVPLSVCRLRVALPLVRDRLARRHAGEPAALDWHLDRCGELDAILERAGVEDFGVDVGPLTVAEVASAVLDAWGLPR